MTRLSDELVRVVAARERARFAVAAREAAELRYDAAVRNVEDCLRAFVGQRVTVQINRDGSCGEGTLVGFGSDQVGRHLILEGVTKMVGIDLDDRWRPLIHRIAWVETVETTRVEVSP